MYVKTAGMGAAYENGVLIPSTSDPANTPIVMNPSPGQNLQIAASQVPLGTLSSSGQACNTAGGYVWNPATALCERPGQGNPQASATPPGYSTTIDPTTGSTMLVQNPPTMTASPQQCTTPQCLADMAALNAGGAAELAVRLHCSGFRQLNFYVAAVVAALFVVSK